MFYLIGEDFPGHDHINGFRFISAKSSSPYNFLFRVEIWVNFDTEQTELLNIFRNSFQEFIKVFEIKKLNISFKNNKWLIKCL